MNEKSYKNSDLRGLLIESINDVKDGNCSPKQAGAIAALASQVLKSASLDLQAASILKGDATSHDLELSTQSGIEDRRYENAIESLIKEQGHMKPAIIAAELGITVDDVLKVASSEKFMKTDEGIGLKFEMTERLADDLFEILSTDGTKKIRTTAAEMGVDFKVFRQFCEQHEWFSVDDTTVSIAK